MLKKWEKLPRFMQTDIIREYYEYLSAHRFGLAVKRGFDIFASLLLLIILLLPMLVVAVVIKCGSRGPVFFRQTRVTAYGKRFRIFKFRTMTENAGGSLITVRNDSRVTGVGKTLRRLKLDELPQLINILRGEMSFVGTRPEVERYVEKYTDEMNATLLLPAGLTSEASVRYRNENALLDNADDADEAYINLILPEKMKYNLRAIGSFSVGSELATLLRTVRCVFVRE